MFTAIQNTFENSTFQKFNFLLIPKLGLFESGQDSFKEITTYLPSSQDTVVLGKNAQHSFGRTQDRIPWSPTLREKKEK